MRNMIVSVKFSYTLPGLRLFEKLTIQEGGKMLLSVTGGVTDGRTNNNDDRPYYDSCRHCDPDGAGSGTPPEPTASAGRAFPLKLLSEQWDAIFSVSSHKRGEA